MSGFIYILLILIGMIGLQIFLSLRSNKYVGLIIPFINLLISIFISLQFSDFFVAILVFILFMIFMVIWLGIYQACKKKIDQKKQNEIKRMKINDL